MLVTTLKATPIETILVLITDKSLTDEVDAAKPDCSAGVGSASAMLRHLNYTRPFHQLPGFDNVSLKINGRNGAFEDEGYGAPFLIRIMSYTRVHRDSKGRGLFLYRADQCPLARWIEPRWYTT
jgi:hypothetical protein